MHVTDEKTIQLEYGLAGPKDPPPGRPVGTAQPGPKPKLIAPADAAEPHCWERVSDRPEDTALSYTLTPDRPADPDAPGDGPAPLCFPPKRIRNT